MKVKARCVKAGAVLQRTDPNRLHGRVSKFAWRWVQRELYRINFPTGTAAEEAKQ